MSTVNDNVTNRRFSDLAKTGLSLVHTSDLSSLWQIKDKNLLYVTISRYRKAGLLCRVRRGFYAIRDISKVHPWELGVSYLRRFAYVSTESILVRAGIIMQQIQYVTMVSSVSRRFKIGDTHYLSRQINPNYLAQIVGISPSQNGRVLEASTDRAVADLLYFQPKYSFDQPQAINWDNVRKIETEIGYPITKRNS